MQKKIFGTDGIRGKANEDPMTSKKILDLATAIGQHFINSNKKHMVVIGKDTRLSGYMLETALTSGFIAVGMDVTLLGPLPTPAVSMLTRSLRASLGIVISASHNPYYDNGVKIFGPDGYKLSDKIEHKIEERIFSNEPYKFVTTPNMGRARRLNDAQGRYIEFLKSTFPRDKRLDGLKIVVDAAHGASYNVAPSVFWELGAEVIPICITPDGCNINNKCGVLDTNLVKKTVIKHKADLGISLDGDADRVILIDEKGNVIDGDQIIGLIASNWQDSGLLKGEVVGTVMSNLGLENYFRNRNIGFVRTSVGDRYVVEYMQKNECNIGGEQSGHIILNDFCTTGDGLLAALQVLSFMKQSGKKISEITNVFKPIPQIIKNINISDNPMGNEKILSVIRKNEKELNGHGRLFVRKSGTEPVVRIMAEGPDKKKLMKAIKHVVDVIKKEGYWNSNTHIPCQ